MYGSDGIIDMEQIGSGFRWNLDRVTDQLNYFDWYDGEFAKLWPSASVKNGLSLIDINTDLVKLNVFQMCSDYYIDAILSTTPILTSEEEALDSWLKDEDVARQLKRGLEKAIRHWAVTGQFIFGVFEGEQGPKLRAISPPNFAGVVDPADDEMVIGYNLVYPIEQLVPGDPNRLATKGRPQQIMVTRWTPKGSPAGEYNVTDTYAFSFGGNEITNLISSEPGGVLGIFPSEPREGFYGDIYSVAAHFMLHKSRQSGALHEFSNPSVLFPAGAQRTRNLAAVDGSTEDTQGKIDGVEDALLSGRRAAIPLGPEEDGQYGYLEFDVENILGTEFVDGLADWLYQLSGVPPASYGVHVGANESGQSRKIAMLRSTQLIKEVRNELEYAIPAVLKAMGAPEGEINFAWAADPATDEGDHVQNLLALKNAGIVSDDEVRSALGFAPMSEEQRQEQQEAANQRMEEMRLRNGEVQEEADGDRGREADEAR